MNINLLPDEYRTKPSFPFVRLLLILCWAFLLLGALVFLGGEYFEYDLSWGELSGVEAQLADFQGQLHQEQDLQTLSKDIEERQAEVNRIPNLYHPWLNLLTETAQTMPSDLWLTSFKGTAQGSITITGNTVRFTAIGDLVRRLQETAMIQNPGARVQVKEIRRLTMKGKTGYQFILEIETGRAALEYSER